jgi:hypothetical protein
MKKNPLFKSFCLVGLFVLFFLQIEGQVKSQKRSAAAKPARAKRLEIQRKKLRDEISFYKIEGKKAICVMGAYIEDLFMVKKNGVLKARGLFE